MSARLPPLMMLCMAGGALLTGLLMKVKERKVDIRPPTENSETKSTNNETGSKNNDTKSDS
ncbi:MAG: hypothetical protein Edafosvirus7_26 [Edafosvirus sp.]|uniref:Uncharacterized protein n=1 Tax=Edafosvirus sp. TaxID=2487765 RepID=A0A3G4ZV79_9VIRU|nr:MAG: hypothetical protein Edafosvirus7_26 [Edafosvirus sp.]